MATSGSNGIGPRNNNSGKNEQMRAGGRRKGPWTPEEDAILKEYVMKNGGGNWNDVQKFCGLNRCGKSCRLRWVNHLRPYLKRGAFSVEEEAIVVHLHSTLGNKWARMTSQLPGRTDNEIKNFWNTRLKKRRRANLPIYPTQSEKSQIINQKESTPIISSSTLQSSSCMTTLIQPSTHEQFYNNKNMPYVPNNNPNQNCTIFNCQKYINNAFVSTRQHNVSFVNNNNNNNNNNNSSSISAFSSKPVTQYKSYNLGSNTNPAFIGSQPYEQNGHQVVYTTTPQADISNQHSNVNYEQNGVYTTTSQVDLFNQHSNANDGLLEDIVNQAKTMCEKSKKKMDSELCISLQDLSLYGGQHFIQEEHFIPEEHFHESNFFIPSTGTKVATASSMESNVVEYNFFNTVGNLPVTTCGPMPVWYDRVGPVPTAQSFNYIEAAMGNRQELFNSSNSIVMETSQAFMDSSSHRNIMPGVHSNSTEMATFQPFMDNSGGQWNMMPGDHHAFNVNGTGNSNISGIQWSKM